MHRTASNTHSRGYPTSDYSEDTAHTVEVQREVDENGEFGSFGFTLLYERPPIVGTVVPGQLSVQISMHTGIEMYNIVLFVDNECQLAWLESQIAGCMQVVNVTTDS